VQQWRPGYPDPVMLLDHIRNGGIVVAHGAMFERTIWNEVLIPRYVPHWPRLRIEQQKCTMAKAAAMGLPMGLEQLADVLALQNRKDMIGASIMKKMMRPKAILPDGTMLWHDDPELIDRNMAYCDQDVRSESEADEKIPDLTPYEFALWHLDQHINDRGVHIDVDLVERSARLALVAKRRANARMREITGGYVKKCTETAKLVEWINDIRGVPCESIKKGDQDDLIEFARLYDDDAVREAVELRRAANKTSTAKYDKMLQCVCADNRIRGLLQYHGAGPGRWAGRLVQPQNYPRVDEEKEGHIVEHTIAVLSDPVVRAVGDMEYRYDMVDLGCDTRSGSLAINSPLIALSKTLRATITAPPGKKLVGGDFSNIEGRINAWLAGEQWKLDAFAAYDAKAGPDLYQLAYSRSFGIPVAEVGKGEKRQIGKVQELALGYQGGVGAYITLGNTYNVKAYEITKAVKAATEASEWDSVAVRYAKATDKKGLPEDQWTAIKIVVTRWRKAHPMIAGSWRELQDAAIDAVDNPNEVIPVYNGKAAYLSTGDWLYCRLPSGRVICYCQPYVKEKQLILVDKNGDEYEKWVRAVHFWGIDSLTKQWKEKYLYGGLQCENIVQATARCVMDRAMFRVERHGYPLILTVHDELLSEVDEGFGSKHEYERLMVAKEEPWLAGLPLTAEAWEGTRYG